MKTVNYKGTDYEVNSDGRVWRDGVELHSCLNRDGYRQFSVKDESGKWTCMRAARMVALAYIPNDSPEEKTEVNHKDYNRANDNVSNLEWISHADNVRYSVKNRKDISGKHNPNYGNHTLRDKYLSDPDYAIQKQGRPGCRNGKAKPVIMLDENGIQKTFSYMGECCDYLSQNYYTGYMPVSLRKIIRESAKSGVPYMGCTFLIN